MVDTLRDDLWREFPKTAQAFEARFKTEEDCRAYLMKARWGGKPACAKCKSTRVWPIRGGVRYECADCRHQTSLTSGTVFEKTRKPLKLWFRAIFEISSRRTGISAMDLMRIMGFGSYETAWTWLHKLRSAMVRSDSEPLGPFVEMDEALVGGKGGPHKQLVLTAAEKYGRVRFAHAENNDAETCKQFADAEVYEKRRRHHGRPRRLQQEEPRQARACGSRANQGGKARGGLRAGLPLRDVATEALADGHARHGHEAEASAGLLRRVRFPLEPPQD